MTRNEAIRKFRQFGYRVVRTRGHTVLRHPDTGHVVTMTSSSTLHSGVDRMYRSIWRRLERGEYPQVGA